jgi:hypothetical protein
MEVRLAVVPVSPLAITQSTPQDTRLVLDKLKSNSMPTLSIDFLVQSKSKISLFLRAVISWQWISPELPVVKMPVE